MHCKGGGCAWQGGACVAGETATAEDGTHRTRMDSCWGKSFTNKEKLNRHLLFQFSRPISVEYQISLHNANDLCRMAKVFSVAVYKWSNHCICFAAYYGLVLLLMARGKHDWPMFVSKKKECKKLQMIYCCCLSGVRRVKMIISWWGNVVFLRYKRRSVLGYFKRRRSVLLSYAMKQRRVMITYWRRYVFSFCSSRKDVASRELLHFFFHSWWEILVIVNISIWCFLAALNLHSTTPFNHIP